MRLEDIGFYTLSDSRADNTSAFSPLSRCELLVTSRCNFKCPYCRGNVGNLKGNLYGIEAINVIDLWIQQGLKNIRFSGGEPTLWEPLPSIIKYCKIKGVERIAISTNGTADWSLYQELLKAGVNDFSVSLDACCSSDAEKMNGGVGGAWEKSLETIRELSKRTYTTVGMVFEPLNVPGLLDSVKLAHSLGVSDIRIISSAQYNEPLGYIQPFRDIIDKESYPILKYRLSRFEQGKNVRGICVDDTSKCHLVLDDMASDGTHHYPCIIYMREGGYPIGEMGNYVRYERENWFKYTNTHKDAICKKNCLDVCVEYNNRVEGR